MLCLQRSLKLYEVPCFRQYLRARGQRLADLHETRAQILQHGAELLGREAFEEMVLLHNGVDLPQTAHARLAAQVEPTLGIDLGT